MHPSTIALGTRELSDTEGWLWGSRYFLFLLIPIRYRWCLVSPRMFRVGRKPVLLTVHTGVLIS